MASFQTVGFRLRGTKRCGGMDSAVRDSCRNRMTSYETCGRIYELSGEQAEFLELLSGATAEDTLLKLFNTPKLRATSNNAEVP